MISTKIVHDYILEDLFFPEKDGGMSKQIELTGTWDSGEISWILKMVSEGMNCINVGANVGYFTILLSQIIKDSGMVYAFEPAEDIFKILELNINNKKSNNIKIFKKAVGNYDGQIQLFLNDTNCGDNRCYDPKQIIDRYGDYRNHGFSDNIVIEQVEICKLDSVLINKKIDFMLIDTQGFDLFVLEGAEKILRNNNVMVMFEFTLEWLNYLNVNYKNIINNILSMGYTLYVDIGIPPIKDMLQDVHIEQIASFMDKNNQGHVNLLLKRDR